MKSCCAFTLLKIAATLPSSPIAGQIAVLAEHFTPISPTLVTTGVEKRLPFGGINETPSRGSSGTLVSTPVIRQG